MASPLDAAAQATPSATQLLFARAVILTMELWPAMRLAVSEQWGGPDSKEKRDFLISHICDTYSDERTQTAPVVGAAISTRSHAAPSTPDMDDLADTLIMYLDDEYESRIEDGSAEWVAARIVQLHKIIYAAFPPTSDSLAAAQAEVEKLREATTKLRGQKVDIQRSEQAEEEDDDDDDESGSGDDDTSDDGQNDVETDAMDIDGSGPSQARQRPEPVVDEDGFTTVVKGKRR